MVQDPAKDAFIPGLIGNFNIPKAVIENKVDVLAFLEILVRKGIVTAQELDEIRAAVVAHLNAAYPELELSYTTPDALTQPAAMQQTPPVAATASIPASKPGAAAAPQFVPSAQAPQADVAPAAGPANPAKPLYVQAAPPKFIK